MEEKSDVSTIRSEGLAKFLICGTRPSGEEESVFYNPVQIFNRDISLLVLKVWCKERGPKGGSSFYDGLSASG